MKEGGANLQEFCQEYGWSDQHKTDVYLFFILPGVSVI
jgi:hypothetical protein